MIVLAPRDVITPVQVEIRAGNGIFEGENIPLGGGEVTAFVTFGTGPSCVPQCEEMGGDLFIETEVMVDTDEDGEEEEFAGCFEFGDRIAGLTGNNPSSQCDVIDDIANVSTVVDVVLSPPSAGGTGPAGVGASYVATQAPLQAGRFLCEFGANFPTGQ